MKKLIFKFLSFVSRYWLIIAAVIGLSFGFSYAIEANIVRSNGDLVYSIYLLVNAVGLFVLSLLLFLVHIVDDLYCKISGKEPDKSQEEKDGQNNG